VWAVHVRCCFGSLSLTLAAVRLALASCLALGCTSPATDLRSAQDLYRDARYEQAAAWLDALEPELQGMSKAERARFYYLRGMSAFRLGQRADALHYLALAQVLFTDAPDDVPPPWRPVLERTLEALGPGGSAPVMFSPGTPAPVDT
jgi:hypothetical protein